MDKKIYFQLSHVVKQYEQYVTLNQSSVAKQWSGSLLKSDAPIYVYVHKLHMWLHNNHGWWPSDTTRLAVSPASKQMWGCHCLRYAHSFAPPAGWPYYVSHHKSLTRNLSQSLRLNVKMRSAGCGGKKKLKFLRFLCCSKMCVSHFLVHAPQWLVRLTTSSKSHPISQLPSPSLIQPPILLSIAPLDKV